MASSEGIKAGRAWVSVGANDSELQKGLKDAEKKLRTFGKTVGVIGAGIQGLGDAIVGGFLKAAKVFADTGSELNDMAARTGLSVEALSQLGFAAKQSGTDMETVEGAVRKMQKALLAGSEENLQAAGTFATLGLNIKAIGRLSPEKQFEVIAKRIASIPNPTFKAAAAMQVFGKSGTALLPLIDDFDALVKEAKDLGLVMSTADAKAADAFGDALDKVTAQVKRAVVLVGSALAPMLMDLAEGFTHSAKRAFDWIDANRGLIASAFQAGVAISAVGAAVVAAGASVYAFGVTLGVAASTLKGVTLVVAALSSPLALVAAGLVTGAAAFLKYTDAGKRATEYLAEKFAGLGDSAAKAFGAVSEALNSGDLALAARVLWLGVKVEFLKGVEALKSINDDWVAATAEGFRKVSFDIAGAMTTGWALVRAGSTVVLSQLRGDWLVYANFVQDVWASAVSQLLKATNSFAGLVKFKVEEIKGLFSGLAFDAKAFGERLNAIHEDVRQKNEAIDAGLKGQRDARAAAADGGPRGDVLQIAREHEAEQKALRDQFAAGAPAAPGPRAPNDALTRAVADLMKARIDAKLAALKPEGEPGAAGKQGAAPGEERLTPRGLDDALDQSKAKVDVAGSFNASALRGLGVGNSAAEQLNEQKKTNEKLDKLNDKARQGRLVFGS